MKLANALSQRAELQTRIHQLETRLYNNAQVQEAGISTFTAAEIPASTAALFLSTMLWPAFLK